MFCWLVNLIDIKTRIVTLCSIIFRFVYCDDCELTGDNVLQVFYASKKYMLPALTAHCTLFLEENLHPDNVCVVYEQLILYEETAVLDKCRSFIETRTDDILTSSAFVDLSREHLSPS